VVEVGGAVDLDVAICEVKLQIDFLFIVTGTLRAFRLLFFLSIVSLFLLSFFLLLLLLLLDVMSI